MKKLGILVLLATMLMIQSCMKDYTDQVPPSDIKLQDLKVSSSFSWSTSKVIKVNITGLPTQVPVFSTLTISLANGSNLYQGLHEMSENVSLQVIVPAEETTLRLMYGTFDNSMPIEGDHADFSFIPVITE